MAQRRTARGHRALALLAALACMPAGARDAVDADAAAVARFAAALRFPTISHEEPALLDAAAFAAFRDFLRASYPLAFAALEWREVGGHSLLGRWPGTQGGAEPAMLVAHYDVVPVDPGDRARWSVDPFAGEVRDGFVWGRGAIDDKVNVIAILEATERLLEAGWRPRQDVWLGFGHDEETGGTEGAGRIAALLAGSGLRLRWIVDEGGAVVLPGMMPGVRRPVALVGVAEKGYLSLELGVRAAGGHSSAPQAEGAIPRLARALVALEESPFPARYEYLGELAEAIAPALDPVPRLLAAHVGLLGPLLGPWLDELPEVAAMTRVTIAQTRLSAGVKDNVQPTEARATLNLRLLPGVSAEEARARVAALVAPYGAEVRVLKANEASSAPSSREGPGWRTLGAAVAEAWAGAGPAFGADGAPLLVAPVLVLGGTDLKHYEPIARDAYRFSFVPMAQEDFRRVHGIDERMPVEGFLSNVRFHQALLRRAGDGEGE